MSNLKNNQKGGDGYSVNVNEAIGGRPAFPRYSSNYSPVFVGQLLQDGAGKNNTNNINCGCNKSKRTIYDLIKKFNNFKNNQKGGKNNNKNNNKNNKKNNNKVTQFDAIREVSNSMSSLSTNSLKKMITKLFFKNLSDVNKLKTKQLGGYSNQLSHILAPLGKNNLLVIAALLLLHHFAVESNKKKDNKQIKKEENKQDKKKKLKNKKVV